MSGYSDIITSGWLVLITLHLLFPFLFLCCFLIFHLYKRVALSSQAAARYESLQDRRLTTRINGENLLAIVTDKKGRTVGKVMDVSAEGICIAKLSKGTIELENDIIFSGIGNRTFSLLIKPRWKQRQKSSTLIGASIIKSPSGWPEYILATS